MRSWMRVTTVRSGHVLRVSLYSILETPRSLRIFLGYLTLKRLSWFFGLVQNHPQNCPVKQGYVGYFRGYFWFQGYLILSRLSNPNNLQRFFGFWHVSKSVWIHLGYVSMRACVVFGGSSRGVPPSAVPPYDYSSQTALTPTNSYGWPLRSCPARLHRETPKIREFCAGNLVAF